tara:strand:+ start:106 stop:1494 length:1389 start_codon:yes stop_codon:yes gene_type:complete
MKEVKENFQKSIFNKRITVIGLGISGKAVSILANHLGAIVFVSDSGSSKEINLNALELMHKHHIASETGIHSNKIYDSDLWIISPGVPADANIINEAVNRNIPIISEIEFASWFTNSPIIGITGSNGKTTTTHILNQMFQGHKTIGVIGGNVGIPFSECVLKEIFCPNEKIVYLLEISSFQLEFISSFCPLMAIYTNISEDHLDRHHSMQKYIKMKKRLSKNFTEKNTVIFNVDDEILMSIFNKTELKTLTYGIKNRNHTFYIKNNSIHYKDSNDFIIHINDLIIKGEHNILNCLAAATCADAYGIRIEEIENALRSFKGVNHRIEYVSTLKDVDYVNDSKATNINSVLVAIKAFTRPVILLLGGYNKGADFRLLIPHIKSNSVKTVLTYGEAGEQIKSALGDAVRSFKMSDLSSAVKKAHLIAQPGDTVLLSPGCASFDQFKNFEVRGDFFKAAVNKLSRL